MSEQHSHPEQVISASIELHAQTLQEIERLQNELDTLRDQLAWSNRLSQLGELTAALAHEYNNLLTPIGSYAELALAKPDDTALAQKALQIAVQGVAKARRLAEGTLGLACPEMGDQLSTCQVTQAVDDAIRCMSPLAKAHQVQLETNIEPAQVQIDALALEQVLINLISNACNAMAQQGGKRMLQIISSLHGSRLTLRISDTGPGIAKEIQNQLFKPFTTHPGNTPGSCPGSSLGSMGGDACGSSRGNGLGLSICKRLIESAGGTINLTSTSPRGAVFQLELPLA